MTAWTNIPKPTGANYTNVNPMGKEQYDQSSIMYDDPMVFYDGVNQAAWTNIAKPSSATGHILRGMATGLLMPLTYAVNYNVGQNDWTKVSKPTT